MQSSFGFITNDLIRYEMLNIKINCRDSVSNIIVLEL